MNIGCVVDEAIVVSVPDLSARLGELGCAGMLCRDVSEWRDCEASTRALVGHLRAGGLKLIGLCRDVPGGEDEAGRDRAVQEVIGHVGQAQAMGADALVVMGGPRSRTALGCFMVSLDRVMRTAAQHGLGVLVANRAGTCVEQLDDLRALVAPDRHAGLRLLLDAGEFYEAAVNPRDVWAEYGDRTACVVISDCAGGQRVRLGAGRVNVAGLVAALIRDGYAGWLVVDSPGETAGRWLQGLREDLAFMHGLMEVD